jgi:hypothetical protein
MQSRPTLLLAQPTYMVGTHTSPSQKRKGWPNRKPAGRNLRPVLAVKEKKKKKKKKKKKNTHTHTHPHKHLVLKVYCPSLSSLLAPPSLHASSPSVLPRTKLLTTPRLGLLSHNFKGQVAEKFSPSPHLPPFLSHCEDFVKARKKMRTARSREKKKICHSPYPTKKEISERHTSEAPQNSTWFSLCAESRTEHRQPAPGKPITTVQRWGCTKVCWGGTNDFVPFEVLGVNTTSFERAIIFS